MHLGNRTLTISEMQRIVRAHGVVVKKIDPIFIVDEEWLNKDVERLVVKDIHTEALARGFAECKCAEVDCKRYPLDQ